MNSKIVYIDNGKLLFLNLKNMQHFFKIENINDSYKHIDD